MSWISAGFGDGCYDSHYDSAATTAMAVAATAAATAATTQPRRFDGRDIQATCTWKIRLLSRQVSAVCHPKTWPLSSKENLIPMRKRGRPNGSKDKELRKRQKATGGGDTTELATKKASMPTVQASKALESHKYIGFDISSMVGG